MVKRFAAESGNNRFELRWGQKKNWWFERYKMIADSRLDNLIVSFLYIYLQ